MAVTGCTRVYHGAIDMARPWRCATHGWAGRIWERRSCRNFEFTGCAPPPATTLRVVLERDELLHQMWHIAELATEDVANDSWGLDDKAEYLTDLLDRAHFDFLRELPDPPIGYPPLKDGQPTLCLFCSEIHAPGAHAKAKPDGAA